MAQQAWVQQWNRARRPPRRSKTAFACFIASHYHDIRGQLGTRKPQIVYRTCAQLWRNMAAEDRQRYLNMEAEDRRRYLQARDQWARKFPGRVPRIRRRRKDRDSPKQPRNPFVFYRMEHWKDVRTNNPFATQQETTTMIAKNWRNVPEEEKQRYKDMTEKDRERYAIDMSHFRYQQAEMNAERRLQNFESRIEALRIRDAYRRRRQEIEQNLMNERNRAAA